MEIKYYEGLNRVKKAYEDELEACKNTEVLSAAGSIDDIFKFFPEKYWDRWNRQFVKQRSTSKMLVHYSDAAIQTARRDKEYVRETRSLDYFPLKVNIDIFNHVVLIISYYDKLALWVESKILADSCRILFHSLLENRRPAPEKRQTVVSKLTTKNAGIYHIVSQKIFSLPKRVFFCYTKILLLYAVLNNL